MSTVFWMIIAIGLAIPSTIILIVNVILAIVSKDNYSLDLKKMSALYFVMLLSYATIFGMG